MSSPRHGSPRRQLGLFDSICIIVGIVVGAGIYETSPAVAASVPGAGWFMLVWIAGGLVSLAGAMCYAELATAWPREGGDYLYLTRAYGARTGFLFTWMQFWVVQPGNIGALAFIFASYWAAIVPAAGRGPAPLLWAAAAVLVLTVINVLGVRYGKRVQNALTVLKVAGLLAVCLAGVFAVPVSTAASVPVVSGSDLGLAMILVLFTYGGWRNISFVAAEVVDPDRNLLRSLLLGTGGVIAIYLLVNLVYLRVLGHGGVAASDFVAADVAAALFGDAGRVMISVLICITCLGNINGMVFTNARIYYAFGADHPLFGWLGGWNRRFDSPARALAVQAGVTVALILAVGANQDAFARLVVFSAPVHWFFSLLVAASLMILRRREAEVVRPFRVPWYPVLPIIYCCSTGLLCYASAAYAIGNEFGEGIWILVSLAAGLLFSRIAAPVVAPLSKNDDGN